METLAQTLARSLASLRPAAEGLEREALQTLDVESAIRRGLFTPIEDEALAGWFARLLTVRSGLWEVVDDASRVLRDDLDQTWRRNEWRCFLAGYASACLIVRLDRLIVDRVARHKLVQRKLNEGFPERRVPRKQFTAIYASLADPAQAQRLLTAMRHLEANREFVETLRDDATIGWIVDDLPGLERSLDPSKRRFFDLLRRFGAHAFRRRGASLRQQSEFAVIEAGGRLASGIQLSRDKRVPGELAALRKILAPGDVLVTRHEGAMTNLFLPGYWPHAALHVGTHEQRSALGDGEDQAALPGPGQEECVLEALKDGVRFRRLESTLAVDAVAVIRPRLEPKQILSALVRAAEHEGKLYNFDFDFFRSDRLVCTEVVYRAFDGIGPMRFELSSRSGRPTLSAEDLLDLALDSQLFEPVAILGTPDSEDGVVTGPDCRALLLRSYRPGTASRSR